MAMLARPQPTDPAPAGRECLWTFCAYSDLALIPCPLAGDMAAYRLGFQPPLQGLSSAHRWPPEQKPHAATFSSGLSAGPYPTSAPPKLSSKPQQQQPARHSFFSLPGALPASAQLPRPQSPAAGFCMPRKESPSSAFCMPPKQPSHSEQAPSCALWPSGSAEDSSDRQAQASQPFSWGQPRAGDGPLSALAEVAGNTPADLVMLSGSNVAEQIAGRLQHAQRLLLQLRGKRAPGAVAVV